MKAEHLPAGTIRRAFLLPASPVPKQKSPPPQEKAFTGLVGTSPDEHPALGIDGSALFLVVHEDGEPKGQGTHTADEHGKDQNKLGDGSRLGVTLAESPTVPKAEVASYKQSI